MRDNSAKQRRTMRRITLVGAVLAAMLFGVFATGAQATTSHARCVVPALSGHTLQLARRDLVRHGCALGRVHRPNIASGALVVKSQSVRPGRRLEHGARISLWLHVRPTKTTSPTVGVVAPTVTVPPVAGPTPTTPTTPTPTVIPVVHASIDPTFTQSSADNLHVTWAYDAGVDDGTLPTGVLSLSVTPASGGLGPVGGCTMNVDSVTTGGTCTVELPQYGKYSVTVTFTGSSSTVAPATLSETDDVEPLPLTLTKNWGVDSAAPTVSSTLIGQTSSVKVTDSDFKGASTLLVSDNTGASCDATVSGTTASCEITDLSTPSSYEVQYPGGTSTTTTQPVAPNGSQSVTTNWPADVVAVDSPAVTVQRAVVQECGGSFPGSGWTSSGTCSYGSPIAWPNPVDQPLNENDYFQAQAFGSDSGLATDGYLVFTVSGGTLGTDYQWGDFQNGPDNDPNSCSEVTTQSYDSSDGTYGPDEPNGSCWLKFLTDGTYTVSVSYVSENPNFASVAGPSVTVNAGA